MIGKWLTKWLLICAAGLLSLLVAVELFIAWWQSLSLIQQLLIWVFVFLVIDRFLHETLSFSPLAAILTGIGLLGASAKSGREQFDVGFFDKLRNTATETTQSIRQQRADGTISVDHVDRCHQDAPPKPQLKTDVSQIILGQSGTGKSTYIKSQIADWDLDDRAVIAHALSESADTNNEFAGFFQATDQDVVRLSSRNSDARWDPFLDFSQEIRDMENIAEGVFHAEETVDTGWTQPAKSLMVAALVVTSAKYDDFAKLPEVLNTSPRQILDDIEKIPDAELVASPLRGLSESDITTIHSVVLNTIRPLLSSELFDEDLPRLSLRDYFQNPDGVIVLDNIQRDRFARGFWRFFLQSAIDFSFESATEQYFVIDELDKLPRIPNLTDLASAGRSADSLGVFSLQDIHQLRNDYDEMAHSVWVNCPNRVSFNPGDKESAEFALSAIGEYEVENVRVSQTRDRGSLGKRSSSVSRTKDEVVPILPSDLLDAQAGEALVQSPEGWWLCKLSQPDL